MIKYGVGEVCGSNQGQHVRSCAQEVGSIDMYLSFGWNDIAQIKGSLQKDQLKILLQKYYLLGYLAMHFFHQSNEIV